MRTPQLRQEREWFLIKGARRATSRNTRATSYSYHPLAESLLIKTFGNDVTSQPTECEKVKVSMGNINKLSSREIEVLVVPTICSPMPTICSPIRSQEINTAKNKLAHLQDIELTDSNHGRRRRTATPSLGLRLHWNRPFATNDHMVQNPPC